VFLIPTAIELVNFKMALIGAIIAPNKPVPSPLKKPLIPSFFAYLYGLRKIPLKPFPSSRNVPFIPSNVPASKF
jgi:hypothetical protein